MTTLYIVRHGQSLGNAKADEGSPLVYTELGSELSELGVQQAEKLAEEFRDIHFDAVYSSDFIRAKQTAEIVKAERKLEVTTKELLRERNVGKYRGRIENALREEFKELFAEYDAMPDSEKFNWKLGETWESTGEAVTRLITVLREIALAYPDKTVLIVCHSTLMRSFLVKLGYGTYEEIPSGSIANTGYFIIESDGIEFFLKEVHGQTKYGKGKEE